MTAQLTATNLYFLLFFVAITGSFFCVILALALFLKVKKLVRFQAASIALETNMREAIVERIVLESKGKLDDIVDSYRAAFVVSSGDHFSKLDRALDEQVRAISEFVKKQEDLILRQSQFAVERLIAQTTEGIEKYKEFQLKRVDEDARVIIGKVSKEVLRRSISPEEHENLIWQALEKARAEGIFRKEAGSGGARSRVKSKVDLEANGKLRAVGSPSRIASTGANIDKELDNTKAVRGGARK